MNIEASRLSVRERAGKPKLAPEHEARVKNIDMQSADCYAKLEHISAMALALADSLKAESASIPIEISSEQSTITHIAAAGLKISSMSPR